MSEAPYTKISEITTVDLADYLRISELDAPQVQLLTTIKAAAINFIVGVTGLQLEQLDNYPDLTLAVYALSQDMYDNRTYYVDKANISDTVSTILNMYRINLL
jgi:hypothetical protein